MKHLLTILAAVLVMASCSTTRYVSVDKPEVNFDAEQVLYEQHPELVEYYEAGVLKITSLKEVIGEDGIATYDIKYVFTKHYITDYHEQVTTLKEYFPEIYIMYVNGAIKIHSIYRFVNEEGQIGRCVNYSPIYDFYYYYQPFFHPYGGYRFDYLPRAPRQPRPQPQRPPRQPRPKR